MLQHRPAYESNLVVIAIVIVIVTNGVGVREHPAAMRQRPVALSRCCPWKRNGRCADARRILMQFLLVQGRSADNARAAYSRHTQGPIEEIES